MAFDRLLGRGFRAPFALVTVLLLLLTGVGVAQAPAASAHARLASSNPVDGSTVTTLPANAEFVFNEDINPAYAQLVVKDSTGSRPLEPVTVRGPSVTAPLPRGLAAGTLTLGYRVVSADGHPVSGEVTVTYSPAKPTATPGASTGSTAPATPSAAATSAAPAQNAGDDGNGLMLALGGLGALVLVVVIALLVVVDRRRRHH